MVNSVVLVGTMTKDFKVSQSGSTDIGTFTVRLDSTYNGKTFNRYIDISMFGKSINDVTARKGDVVAVTGRLDTAKDGDTYRLRVTADKVNVVAASVPTEQTTMEAF